jgi:hypothetical protein
MLMVYSTQFLHFILYLSVKILAFYTIQGNFYTGEDDQPLARLSIYKKFTVSTKKEQRIPCTTGNKPNYSELLNKALKKPP